MKFTTTEKLRKARLERDYSQEYVAYALGISQKSYSDIENGKTLLHQKYLESCANYTKKNQIIFASYLVNIKKHTRLNKILLYLKENNIEIPF